MYPQFPRMTKPAAGARPWFEIQAAAGDGPAEIRSYESIGGWGLHPQNFPAFVTAVLTSYPFSSNTPINSSAIFFCSSFR